MTGQEEAEDVYVEENVNKVIVFKNGRYEDGYVCELCKDVFNSLKLHTRHMLVSHEARNFTGEEYSIGEMQATYIKTKTLMLKKEDTGSSKLTSESATQTQILDEKFPSQFNYQLKQVTLAKEEQEGKLIICQNKVKICQQSLGNTSQTLQLLEEELEIQRTLRDLERELLRLKIQLRDSSVPFSSTASSPLALNQIGR